MVTETCGRDARKFVTGAETKAANILALLKSEASFDKSLATAGQNALFARLYFCTTRRWVEYAKSCDNPELLYLVVGDFYGLYNQYVAKFDNTKHNSVEHWKRYQRLVANGKDSRLSGHQLIALFMGIRAHTRFDLAEAICSAHDRYEQLYGRAPNINQFRALMFGREANDVFRQASVDFISSIFQPGQGQGQGLVKCVFRKISMIWLPMFQGARKLAWREAQNSISSGRSICRQNVSSAVGHVF